MRRAAFFLPIVSAALAGCTHEGSSSFQGYVEGEYVYVASPVGGRLERLAVQRGQTIEAKCRALRARIGAGSGGQAAGR